jgi:hypothetical protein
MAASKSLSIERRGRLTGREAPSWGDTPFLQRGASLSRERRYMTNGTLIDLAERVGPACSTVACYEDLAAAADGV